jgi:hypothetical protein
MQKVSRTQTDSLVRVPSFFFCGEPGHEPRAMEPDISPEVALFIRPAGA